MRDDYRHAAAMLRTLGLAIQTCPAAHKSRLSAYVIKLGRLVRDQPIVRAALIELEHQEQADEQRYSERVRDLSARATACFKRLAEATGPLSDPAKHLISQLGSLTARNSAPGSFKEILRLALRNETVEFTVADTSVFHSNVCARLTASLQPLAEDDPEIDDVLGDVTAFGLLAAEASHLFEIDEILKRLSIGRVATRLRAYANRWEGRLLGSSSAESATGPNGHSVLADGIEQDIPPIVDLIVAQIEDGIARRHAVHRLRVFFEHFECDDLRGNLQTAEQAGRPREAILQHSMDRFLFQDGYFPVTHAEASRGYLDTLVLERAESSGVPPLLVELKQVTGFTKATKATRAAVTTAIGVARGEVARYRGHIASRPHWSGTLPIIVVVHTCVEDLSDLEADDVVLIDLCDRTPSKKTPQQA